MKDFNLTAVDNYFNKAEGLKRYNLTTTANNLTVGDFGWDEQRVYDALDDLNDKTVPHYYSLQNYTNLDLNDFPAGDRQSINETKVIVDARVVQNTTVYEAMDTTKQQLYDTQTSITILMQNLTTFQDDYHHVTQELDDLVTKNITNANNIITGMLDQIEAFFQLGDCSFVGKSYRAIKDAICSVMEPAIELLMAGSYMIAIGLIPTIILAEVLAIRVTHPADDEKVYPDKGYYTYDDDKPGNNKLYSDKNAVSMGVHAGQE